MNIVKKGSLCYYGFMIGFFIKKAFFDGWDNLLQIMLLNVIMLGVGFGGFYLAGATTFFIPLSLLVVAVAASLEGALLLTVSSMMARVADYKSFNAKDFLASFRSNLFHGFLFAAVITSYSIHYTKLYDSFDLRGYTGTKLPDQHNGVIPSGKAHSARDDRTP